MYALGKKTYVWFIIHDDIRDAVVGKANAATPGDEMDVNPAKIQIPDGTVAPEGLPIYEAKNWIDSQTIYDL